MDLECLREMTELSEPLSDWEPNILQSYIDSPPHQGPLSGFNYDYHVDADSSTRATASSNDQKDQPE